MMNMSKQLKQKDNEIEDMKKIDIIKEGQQELLKLLKHPKELIEILQKE